jgi:hypothetical protein
MLFFFISPSLPQSTKRSLETAAPTDMARDQAGCPCQNVDHQDPAFDNIAPVGGKISGWLQRKASAISHFTA